MISASFLLTVLLTKSSRSSGNIFSSLAYKCIWMPSPISSGLSTSSVVDLVSDLLIPWVLCEYWSFCFNISLDILPWCSLSFSVFTSLNYELQLGYSQFCSLIGVQILFSGLSFSLVMYEP